MKATEQYFPVMLFIMLYKVVLTFESVDEILKCDYGEGNKLLSNPCLWFCGSEVNVILEILICYYYCLWHS